MRDEEPVPSPNEWKKLISQLHFATHFIVGPSDAALWLWLTGEAKVKFNSLLKYMYNKEKRG